jgi:putative oxidoreductase
MGVGRVIVRVVIGGLFIGHGTQKLAGWFDGPGLDGTEAMMSSLELAPARKNALASAVTETAGGALLVAGLATPAAAAGLIGSMITAIRTVHGKNGPWVSNRGWEYNVVLIASLVGLVEAGPGAASLDAALGRVKSGPAWALGSLAAGAAASAAIVALGRKAARAEKAADDALTGDALTGDAPMGDAPMGDE